MFTGKVNYERCIMQNLTETYKAVIYIRLSDADDKPGESDSVANQRKLIYDWLKNHPEIEVVAEKVDDGFSGLLFDRPAFKEMMGDIEAGIINCCVCKEPYVKHILKIS